MDYLAPPMFDVSNINMWKLRMSLYLKILGLHVFLTATKHGSKSRSRPPTRPAPRRIGLGDSNRTRTIRAKLNIES